MNFLRALYLLLVMKIGKFTEGFYLSPLGVIYTCSSDQVLLNCVTNGMFLEWNITTGPNYSRQRLISSSETRDIPSLSVNRTMFIFVRESRYPLNITLFVINATVDWQISCIEYSSSDSTQNTLETTISIIEVIHINRYLNASLDMIAVEPSFGEDNITLHVRLLEGMHTVINGLIYGAIFTSSLEETIRVGSDGANVEVTIPYNVQYNLTTFAVLCGYENQSDTLSLFYTNCGPPAPPPNGYVNVYNSTQEASTREGAEVNITCLSEPQQQHTMICSAGGQWEPDFSGFCKNVSEPSTLDPLSPSRNTTTTSHSAWMIITITVTVSTFALLSVVCGLILIKLCQSKSSVSSESFPDPHGHLPNAQVIPVYEAVFPMEFQEENVELKDNVAYGTIRQLPAAIIK